MAHTMTSPPQPPWYRQLWPWLLMLMPATALFGGIVTFWLASTTNNSLVVDDYYREGKAINMQLARDRAAQAIGLSGTLARGADGRAVLSLASATGAMLPASIRLQVLHATRSELDRTLTLARDAQGMYRSTQEELPDAGRWNVVLEDPDRSWRLVGVTTGFNQPLEFAVQRR